jgi:glutamyl-Q tRNA(Asp) synthetase
MAKPAKAMYEEALDRLRGAGPFYRCRCSRKEIADSGLRGIEGAVYPGTCRKLQLGTDVARAERFIVPAGKVEIEDRVQGPIVQDVAHDVGDFVLKRRDRFHGYQLAVVVDDAEQAITDVVRGADLLQSTPRQVLLQRAWAMRCRVISTSRPRPTPPAKNFRSRPWPGPWRLACAELIAAGLSFLGQPGSGVRNPVEMLEEAAAQWRGSHPENPFARGPGV